MHLEQRQPNITITKISNLQEHDQRKHSASGSHAHKSGNFIPCSSSTVTPRCNLHCTAPLSSLSLEDLKNSLQTVMFENGYLAAHVDMLRHQHKYTSQILANSANSPAMHTATDCRMQTPAANLRHLNLKKRPAAMCATPTKPDRCDSFPGFCASRPQTTPAPTYPDFKALSTKQRACASSGACLCKTKRYKRNMAPHSQTHCLEICNTAGPHTAEHASTMACGTEA